MYDLSIIGGGPAGAFAAECAGTQGLKVILFEKETVLGGVCVNEGCIPAKSLLHSIKTFNLVKESSKFGVISDKHCTFDMRQAIAYKNKVVQDMQTIGMHRFERGSSTLVQGLPYIDGRTEDGFEIVCNGQTYFSKKLLICTGSHADVPFVPGIDSPAVCTYNALLNTPEIPASIVFIGGGSISIELAHAYHSLGVKVYILEEASEILTDTDNEICAMLRKEYEKKGITIHLNATVVKVENNQVFFEKNGEMQVVEGEKILFDIGRKPNLEGFGLENLDVECYRKGIRINNQMQTSEPNVYAAGDVTGFSKSAHAAYCEAAVAVHTILGINDQMNFKAVSTCIFSNPEIAHVGITEESLKMVWMPHRVIKLPLTESSRYVIENEEFEGMCKIIVSENDIILGVHIIGNNCTESILAAVMAVEARMTISQWRKIVFPYPTIGEVIKGVLISADMTPRQS